MIIDIKHYLRDQPRKVSFQHTAQSLCRCKCRKDYFYNFFVEKFSVENFNWVHNENWLRKITHE